MSQSSREIQSERFEHALWIFRSEPNGDGDIHGAGWGQDLRVGGEPCIVDSIRTLTSVVMSSQRKFGNC